MLRELKKLHLDTASSRKGMSPPEKVANMVTKILSLQKPVKDIYDRASWPWQERVQSFNKKIGTVDFYETHDLYHALESFFRFQYGINIGVYEIVTEGDGELVAGNMSQFQRNIYLWKNQETWILDYALERKCLQSQEFEVSHNIRGAGGRGAIPLGKMWNNYAVLSLGNLDSPFHEIRMIQREFEQFWFDQMLRSKLNSIHAQYRDAVTGLYNQRYFNQIKHKHPYSFVCIQLHEAKGPNDGFTPRVWDHALQITARILESSIRKNDRAVRLWWNEFFLLIDAREKSILERISSMIRTKFHEYENAWKYHENFESTWNLKLDTRIFEQKYASKHPWT